MAAALNTIGLIAGIAGLADLANNQFVPPEAAGTGLTVKLGLSDKTDGVTGLGGGISYAYAFDSSNSYLGEAPGGEAEAGGVVAITIDQDVPDRQGRYISITSQDDSACVMLAVVSAHDMSYVGTWSGDVGKFCGQAWYHGNEVGGVLSDGTVWKPACTWFSTSGDSGALSGSWKFDSLAYGISSKETVDSNVVCESTIYSTATGVISDKPDGPAKRSAPAAGPPVKRTGWIAKTLIVSKSSNQTAEELCTSPTSHGPDFVDSNGDFCDMETKTLIPICSGADRKSCVVLSPVEKTIVKHFGVGKRAAQSTLKAYDSIQEWSE